MMRIRSNSKIVHAFLAGRVLLFLLSVFPILGFAIRGDDEHITDSLAYNSSTKINMYVSEGTTIYNSDDIYSVDSNANSIKEATKKHESTKIATASTSLEKKSKKRSQYLQHRKVPVVTEYFNCLPLDPASSFSKNNNKDIALLPVDQPQIKIIGIMPHYAFSVLTRYESKSSSDHSVNITRKANRWQIHTRPPPYNMI